ncbi:pentapeptide repeat-containing protein [Streptomyces sp. NPDC059994]|uniref:pentapeptide repeat-containing protein n=1 Tax=Streptomyces sp. NPDC059994 TaxID=3347029 RepID=UPI0036AE8CD6
MPGHTACLAHLRDTDRTTYLTSLTPGADIDHRGTPFTQDLLAALLHALTDPSTSQPHLGPARFDSAQFTGPAVFGEAQFTGIAWFNSAQFTGPAWFHGAQFTGGARFSGVCFEGVSELGPLVCAGRVVLSSAVFVLPVKHWR